MNPTTERRSYDHELGALSAKVENLEGWVTDISKDVKAIRSAMDQQKGSWKTLAVLGTAAGTIGALLAKYLPNIASGGPPPATP